MAHGRSRPDGLTHVPISTTDSLISRFKQCRHAPREPVRVPGPRRSIRRSPLPRSSSISRAIEAVGLGADLTTCISSDYSIWTLVADATVSEVASQYYHPYSTFTSGTMGSFWPWWQRPAYNMVTRLFRQRCPLVLDKGFSRRRRLLVLDD